MTLDGWPDALSDDHGTRTRVRSFAVPAKEESTGRYINVRFYDLAEMKRYPRDEHIAPLVEVFDEFGGQPLPSLREQFDQGFEARYADHWARQRTRRDQLPLFELGDPDPDPIRVAFDLAVCRALGSAVNEDELRALYQTIVQEMIITRGLTSD